MSELARGSKRLIRLRDQRVIAEECSVADRFVSRFLGLMGRSDFERGEGLLFPKCRSVHMWFMSIPIDIVFLREGVEPKTFTVSRVVSSAKPWSPLPFTDHQAHHTLELPEGAASDLKTGDVLCIA